MVTDERKNTAENFDRGTLEKIKEPAGGKDQTNGEEVGLRRRYRMKYLAEGEIRMTTAGTKVTQAHLLYFQTMSLRKAVADMTDQGL